MMTGQTRCIRLMYYLITWTFYTAILQYFRTYGLNFHCAGSKMISKLV